jgi:hypothetical protein
MHFEFRISRAENIAIIQVFVDAKSLHMANGILNTQNKNSSIKENVREKLREKSHTSGWTRTEVYERSSWTTKFNSQNRASCKTSRTMLLASPPGKHKYPEPNLNLREFEPSTLARSIFRFASFESLTGFVTVKGVLSYWVESS